VFDSIRRLHPRGPLNRGVSVDADGAMLGPDCALVRRTAQGYRSILRNEANALQALVCCEPHDPDRLYRTCERIAEALEHDQLTLAQIYGLHLRIDELGVHQLRGLAKFARVTKAGFNPDEPRIPAGDPHGGEWTTGGDAAAGASDLTEPPGHDGAADSAGDGGGGGDDAPMTVDPGYGGSDAPPSGSFGSGGDTSGDPAISYQIAPSNPAVSHQIAPASTVAAAEAATGSLLGPLAPEALTSLAELAAGMAAPAAFLGILFFPFNRSLIVDGTVQNSPDLAYRYDRDTGFLQIWQANASGDHALLYDGQIDPDDFLHDASGRPIGRLPPGGAVIVDPDLLPGYQARGVFAVRPAVETGTETRAANDNEPKLCPDPSADQDGAPPQHPYQQYVSWLINGRILGPGLAVNLLNPASGKFVAFDDCRLSDGTMIEAKGTSYAYLLQYQSIRENIEADFIDQATRQLEAAGSRPVEWHFAERPAADFARHLFEDQGLPITVIYSPWLRTVR
jgi:hypothetical protein